MKRALFGSLFVSPYTSGDAVDRIGYSSAVLAAKVTAAGTLSVAVTHADAADGTFEAVADERVILYGTGEAAENSTVNVGIDLSGCKRFVKITPDGVTATYALALGDCHRAPAEG